ncbi:hypothetical protein BH09PSE6_BH09PSE6_05520 [soil metagenome]
MTRSDRPALSALAALSAAVALAALAACSVVPVVQIAKPAAEPPVVVLPPAQTLWVEYLRRTRTMSAETLGVETTDALRDSGISGKLQLALLLSAPQNPLRDDSRAATLADEIAAAPEATTPQRDAAVWYAWWLDDQRQIETLVKRAQTRARDDQARIDQLEQRVREVEKRLSDTERRALDAERKLEALKQIERAMERSEQRPTDPVPAAPVPAPAPAKP